MVILVAAAGWIVFLVVMWARTRSVTPRPVARGLAGDAAGFVVWVAALSGGLFLARGWSAWT